MTLSLEEKGYSTNRQRAYWLAPVFQERKRKGDKTMNLKEECIKSAIENRLTQSIIILRDLLENRGRMEYIVSEVLKNTNDFSKEIVDVCVLENFNSLKSFEKEILLEAFRDYIKERNDDAVFFYWHQERDKKSDDE